MLKDWETKKDSLGNLVYSKIKTSKITRFKSKPEHKFVMDYSGYEPEKRMSA